MGWETDNQQSQAGGLASIPSIGLTPVIPSFSGAPTPGVQDPSKAIADKTRQLLSALMARKQMSNTAAPMAIPAMSSVESARNIGMDTGRPSAWGQERFMATLGANIKNAVAKQKEQQLLKAEGDWSYLQSGLNELFAAQQSGDQNAAASAQKKIDFLLSDPKKLKNMAKALNQDWLNPEKTTVYGEALKRTTAKQAEMDKSQEQKKNAATGLKDKIMQLLGQKQAAERKAAYASMTPEEKQAMAREIQERAPSTAGAVDPKLAIEATKAEADMIRAIKTSPEKYELKTIQDKDGSQKIVAVDKTDPTKPYVEIKSSTGEQAKPGQKQFANEGKLEIVAGIPTGRVMHGGKYVAPGQSGYTKEDQDAVNLGLNAQGLSEKQKEKLAGIRGASYASAKAANTPMWVIDNETGQAMNVTQLDAARNPGKYAPPSEGEKIAARESVHRSLKANFGALAKDLDALPNGLDTETQTQIAAALNSDNPGMIETLLVNKVKEGVSDEVLRYITDIKVMQEDILVLRNVGGMGQGSDQMRAAITRTIPGKGTSSVKEAKMQMEGAQRTSESLFTGRPRAKFAEKSEEGKDGVIVVTPEDLK